MKCTLVEMLMGLGLKSVYKPTSEFFARECEKAANLYDSPQSKLELHKGVIVNFANCNKMKYKTSQYNLLFITIHS